MMRSWTLLVLTAALTASAEKLGNIEVITRDQLGQTLDPPAGGSSFGLPLSSPVQDDVPPPLSYLPPVQTPLPIEPTPVPLPTPIQPETDYLPPVASPVGQPEVETPTGLYNPPTAPAPGTNFPTGTDDYDFDYTDSGDNGQDFLSSIQSVQDSKLALLGSLAGAKASLFQGLRKAKSSIATGVSGALLSKGAGFSSLSQTGSGGSYGSGFSSSYGTDYGTNYGTNPRPVGRPYPSDPYPIYPPYPQPQPQPVYPVPVYPVYRPKPNPFAAFKAKVGRVVQAKKLAAALKHAAYKQSIEEKYQPAYPTYPSYPTYPTYPSYPTYPTYPGHSSHGGAQKGKFFGFQSFKAPHPSYHHGGW
ncbi:uncharacterized protein [Penaeus vannamei]|uniref:uncharacterized protein n=1 Tax=Penaeus vannamei TaxID=6689 RepID=UPI000F65B2D6|nr:serine/threonine-protein kinase WNK2-like [Penaeus vannamei]